MHVNALQFEKQGKPKTVLFASVFWVVYWLRQSNFTETDTSNPFHALASSHPECLDFMSLFWSWCILRNICTRPVISVAWQRRLTLTTFAWISVSRWSGSKRYPILETTLLLPHGTWLKFWDSFTLSRSRTAILARWGFVLSLKFQ